VSEAPQPASVNPLALIQTAIDKGVDAEQLSKLMDLQERFERNQAEKAFAYAMNRCQEKMPAVVRNQLNTHTQKMYANLEAVNTAIKPIYTAEGFSLSFGEDESKVADSVRIYVDVIHTGGLTRRHFGDFPLDGAGAKGGTNKTGIQSKGSTISYGRRYLTLMIFNVTVADEDTDGNPAGDTINRGQLEELHDLLENCTRAGVPVAMPAFLKWLGVDNLQDLPQREMGRATYELKRKIKEGPKS
jgi:ERF superfamily